MEKKKIHLFGENESEQEINVMSFAFFLLAKTMAKKCHTMEQQIK